MTRSSLRLVAARIAALALVSALGTACSKKDAAAEAPLAPAASALAPSTAAPASSAMRFIVGPEGNAIFDMPAPKEHIKAETSRAGGVLDVDVRNLANTRGTVKVDLTSLATHTFGTDKDKDQTSHARNWLEVGDAASESTQRANMYAVFAIRSIDELTVSDPSGLPKEKDAVGEFRTVSLKAHGELLLHGRKVPKDAELEVRLRYPSGSADGALPIAVEIKTKRPFVVTLAEHDVKPRDTVGKLAQASLGLLGTKVAETASVTLDLRATPPPP